MEPSGGVIRTGEVQRNFNSGTYVLYGATRTYLSADGQTKVVQRYQVNSNIGNGVYEEYRYDALGRRVLMRSRKTPTPPPGGGTLASLCTVVTGNPCASAISRWVWDGAQLLGETRAPGQDGLTAPALDQLTGSPPSFGTVGYVHIGGWDEPRALMDGRVFNPNWRGLPESSQLADGTAPDCSFGLPGSCITVNWPADVGPYYRQPLPAAQGTIVPTWLGSLAANGATESRRLHRRFREYDPATGQFTQEDPIGLAGGLNLYGFANGDPVNFSDPFGLCPVCVAYALFEVGATGYDLYDLGKTAVSFFRGRTSRAELAITALGVGAGVVGVGGGYGKAAREVASRLIRDVADNPGNWRTVGSFTEAATNKKARGGVSIQTILENEAGDRVVRHTVRDKAGNVIDDHYRPIYKPRDVDRSKQP